MGGMFGGGGSGGSSTIGSPYGGKSNRNFPAEQGTLNRGYGFQQDQFSQFGQNNPLLNAANTQSLDYNQNRLPQMLQQIQGLFGSLGGQADTLGGLMNGPYGPASITATGGALTPQMQRDATQQARVNAPTGSLQNPGAIAAEVLNRDAARQTRYNTALGQQQGLLAQQQGVYGAQGSNLGQEQGVQTGGLNQLLGTLGGGVSAFSGLTNPILGYISNLFQGNQQSQIQQAQINAQQRLASQAKGGSAAGGALSAIGSIAPIALAAFSDERLKTKVKSTGETIKDVPLKTWEYKTNPGVRFLGATAQDIEKKLPSAVFTDPRSGLKVIDTTQFPIVQISAVKPTKKAA